MSLVDEISAAMEDAGPMEELILVGRSDPRLKSHRRLGKSSLHLSTEYAQSSPSWQCLLLSQGVVLRSLVASPAVTQAKANILERRQQSIRRSPTPSAIERTVCAPSDENDDLWHAQRPIIVPVARADGLGQDALLALGPPFVAGQPCPTSPSRLEQSSQTFRYIRSQVKAANDESEAVEQTVIEGFKLDSAALVMVHDAQKGSGLVSATCQLYSGDCVGMMSDGSVMRWSSSSCEDLLGSTSGGHSSISAVRLPALDMSWKSESSLLLQRERVAQVCSGGFHSAALTTSGRLFTWGSNLMYQLGHEVEVDETTPVCVEENLAGQFITHLSCGITHTVATTFNNRIYQWGTLNEETMLPTPTQLLTPLNLVNITHVSAGLSFSVLCATCESKNGTHEQQIFTWGENASGQLGIGDADPRVTPTQVVINETLGTNKYTIDLVSAGVDYVVVTCTTENQPSQSDVVGWGHLPVPSSCVASRHSGNEGGLVPRRLRLPSSSTTPPTDSDPTQFGGFIATVLCAQDFLAFCAYIEPVQPAQYSPHLPRSPSGIGGSTDRAKPTTDESDAVNAFWKVLAGTPRKSAAVSASQGTAKPAELDEERHIYGTSKHKEKERIGDESDKKKRTDTAVETVSAKQPKQEEPTKDTTPTSKPQPAKQAQPQPQIETNVERSGTFEPISVQRQWASTRENVIGGAGTSSASRLTPAGDRIQRPSSLRASYYVTDMGDGKAGGGQRLLKTRHRYITQGDSSARESLDRARSKVLSAPTKFVVKPFRNDPMTVFWQRFVAESEYGFMVNSEVLMKEALNDIERFRCEQDDANATEGGPHHSADSKPTNSSLSQIQQVWRYGKAGHRRAASHTPFWERLSGYRSKDETIDEGALSPSSPSSINLFSVGDPEDVKQWALDVLESLCSHSETRFGSQFYKSQIDFEEQKNKETTTYCVGSPCSNLPYPLFFDLLLNSVPSNQVKKLWVISEGSLGQVWRCQYRGTEVAMKILKPDEAKNARKVKAMIREAVLLSRLRHPSIINMLGVCFDIYNREFGIVMELCERGNLWETLFNK
eukprot:GHVN01066802.1.p1 GENE.GHVN01066802.1~~GHVN01066802.1.p1  ORF type:complete len:1057 (+),score=118.93 GHVN01066802.1:141-3311(+)